VAFDCRTRVNRGNRAGRMEKTNTPCYLKIVQELGLSEDGKIAGCFANGNGRWNRISQIRNPEEPTLSANDAERVENHRSLSKWCKAWSVDCFSEWQTETLTPEVTVSLDSSSLQ